MSSLQVLDRDSESEALSYIEYSPLPSVDGFPPPPGSRWFPPPPGASDYGQTEHASGVDYRLNNDSLPPHEMKSNTAAADSTPRLHKSGAHIPNSRPYEAPDGLPFPHGPQSQSKPKASNGSYWRAADQSKSKINGRKANFWLASGDKASQLRRQGRKLLPGSESFRPVLFTCFAQHGLARCSLAVETSISNFAEVELEPGASLWDLMVLAGSHQSAWATTCQDYISQTWPASSDWIKVLIDRLAQPRARHLEEVNFSNRSSEFTEHQKCINEEDGCPPFRLQADRALVADLIEALAWVSAVMTETFIVEPQLAQICVWVTSLDTTEPTVLIGHDENSPTKMMETSSDCWKRLFPHGIVPSGFPIPSRDEAMEGLELSFDLMCYLCGLEYETSDTSGIVLRGHRSLVYPVRRTGDCVQWHFQHLDLTDHSKSEEEPMSEHLKNGSLDELRSAARHFLGLWAKPEITLGTDRVNHASLTWSNQDEVRETTTKEGIEIGGSISFPRILNVTLNRTYKIASCQRNVYMVDFEGKLQSLINFPVVLYSPVEKRAWLVSYVSVLLHLARARAYHQRSLGYHIPACRPAADGGSSAFQTIMEHHRDPVRSAYPGVYQSCNEPGMTVQDYVNEVWTALDKATLETCKAKGLFRHQIVGYEAADIAKMKTTLRMKRKDLGMFSASWTPLLSEVKLSLFYEGLLDPIIAQPDQIPNTYCCSWLWREVPKGFDLLAASLPCLVYLAEHLNGSGPIKRLTQEYSWHCPSELQLLFCEKTNKHICNRLQELKKNDWRRYNILPPRPEELSKYPDGAVVFKDSVNQETIHESIAALTASQETKIASGRRNRGGSVSSITGSPGRGYQQDWQTNDTRRVSYDFPGQGQPMLDVKPPHYSPASDNVAPAATKLAVWDDPKDFAERVDRTATIGDPQWSQSDTLVEVASPTASSGWAQPVGATRSRRRQAHVPQTRPIPEESQRPLRSDVGVPRADRLSPHQAASGLHQTRSPETHSPSPRALRNPNLTTSWQMPREQTQPDATAHGRSGSIQLTVPIMGDRHNSGSEYSGQSRPSVSSYTSNDQSRRRRHKGGINSRARPEAKKSPSTCIFL
jgi:hypothetical protein